MHKPIISVITPTHNPEFLLDVYASLKIQSFKDWEWVIVPNGSIQCAIDTRWMFSTINDDRIRIVDVAGTVGSNIGDIKGFSFRQGRGDFLVELDHDDLLVPTALEQIFNEFTTKGVDFVYSNFCEFFSLPTPEKPGVFHFYNDYAKNGWRYRTHGTPDTGMTSETVSFDPSAAALSTIYYAPNHVRAWRKKFYYGVGGHEPEYDVCDDHELLIRTYLHGRMSRIDDWLYLYRMGEQNTFSKKLDRIRQLTNQLYSANIEHLVLREGELRGLKCYDLGGAFACPEGWSSVDLHGNVDIVADLSKRWPFDDSSVMAFRCHDVIEHIADKQHFMRELHRCLVPGGWALIRVPSTDGRGAFQDPTHVSYWNENSFWYWTRPEQAQYIRNEDAHFIEFGLSTVFPSDWHRQHNIPYVYADLVAQKGDMTGIPGVRRWM